MKIFFSHTSKDKPLLRELRQHLNPALELWIDEKELNWGDNPETEIRKAITQSNFFVIFLSAEAMQSEWVIKELHWALDRERHDEAKYVLPILLPYPKKGNLPNQLEKRLFIELPDLERNSVADLAKKINERIFRILIDREKSRYSLPEQNVRNLIENASTEPIKEQLRRVVDMASKLVYTLVGSAEIYHHDKRIISGLMPGTIYRATHPFSANRSAYNIESAVFRSYVRAQLDAANRGVIVRRLYILPTTDINELGLNEIQHLRTIRNTRIESRILRYDEVEDNNFGEDFVIINDELLGVAIPKRGDMLGSEYRYRMDSNIEMIKEYMSYFDSIFEGARPVDEILDSIVQHDDRHELNNAISKHDPRRPAVVLQTQVSICGLKSQRLMVVLRTSGCAYDQNNLGCTMCDFKMHSIDKNQVNTSVLVDQLKYALDQAMFGGDDVCQVDLLTLGSFLHDQEVPEESRIALFTNLSQIKGLRKIVIESRSPYVSAKRLRALKDCLDGNVELELGLGVETSSENLRNNVLRKGLADSEIRRVIDVCAENEIGFMAYLLIGTMTLNSKEAVHDAVRSAEYVAKLCRNRDVSFRIAFEPVFITHNTKLEEDFLRGDYSLINLWEVVEVIKRSAHLGTIFVGLSDEGLSSNRIPEGCPDCTLDLREAIERFNGSQSLHEFDDLKCECNM